MSGDDGSSDDVLARLIADFGPAIYRVARSVVRDPGLAEDAVPDTLLKAWQHLAGYRGDAPLSHWVLRIAHNTAVSSLRKRRDEPHDPTTTSDRPTTGSGSDLERDLDGRFAVDQLWTALDRLDGTTRAIVVLREVEGLA